MSGFLLDTDVISMFAPGRAQASPEFRAWLVRKDSEDRVFLSVVAIQEIEEGLALLDHKRATAKAAALRLWLSGLIAVYDDKILVLDANAAALAGRLEAQALALGHDPGFADAAVAGIAKACDLVVITQNTRHFSPFGVAAATPDEAVGSGRFEGA